MAQFQDVDDNWHCRYHHYIYNCRFNCLFITTLYHIYTVSQLRLLLLLYCTYTFIALQIIFLFSILQPKQNTSKTYIFVYFWNFGKSWKFQILASSELKAQFHFMLHTQLIYLYFYISSTCPSPVYIYCHICTNSHFNRLSNPFQAF